MKLNASSAIMAFALVVSPLTVQADDSHANMVMQHGAQVMPFDQSQAMHIFLPDSNGGILEIVVHDMNQAQISLVRSHLLQEAAKFTSGNYSDPAYIHGKKMPGLDQLQSGALRVSVRYFETPTGAAITLRSTDRDMVSAIHQWLAAQQRDHNSSPLKHCAMKM
jgi:hypothetical protein